MNQKVEVISRSGEDVYIIFFIHPQTEDIIFLAYSADIDSICYSTAPSLPGTSDIRLAKQYQTIDEAKKDVYKLRYHHRDFLKITIGAKAMSKFDFENAMLLEEPAEIYLLSDLT